MTQKRSQILFWSAYSRVYDGLLKFEPYADLISDATSRMTVEEGAVVVDLGCGTGNCLMQMLKMSGSKPDELIGIDSSPQMLRVARKKMRNEPRARFVNRSLLDWLAERESDSVDNVITVNVLYTMQRSQRALFWKGLSRVLAPSGNAVVVTTDRAGIGPVAKEHFSKVPLWRAFPPRLVPVLLMNMLIWLFESNDVFDPASLATLVSEAESAGLVVSETKRCYGGETDGVDVMLVLEPLVETRPASDGFPPQT